MAGCGRAGSPWRISVLLLLATAAAPSAGPSQAQAQARAAPAPRYTGVNLSGGEFAGRKIPGIRNRDYGYPDARDFAPFAAMGMNAVRVPVIWQRLQPAALGPLAEDEMAALDKALAPLEARAALVVLDLHGYGAFAGRKLGDDPALDGALADAWRRLAARYRGHPRIAFGLMNEPHGIPARTWRDIAGDALAAIRGAGARNLVLVSGTRWTGAHSWTAGGGDANALAFAGFRDPAGNMAFDMHQYVDRDSSGTKDDCVDAGAAGRRLRAATAWLREQRQRGFLGEFGAPPTPACLAALGGLLTAVDAAGDVWMGWTVWGGGSWWSPRYPLALQPRRDLPEPAQLAVLRRHAGPAR